MSEGPRRRRRPPGPDGGPRSLSEGLEEVVDRLVPPTPAGAPPPGVLGTVFSRWDEIAGPALARHARPLRLTAGELVVAVDEPAWATQVRSLGSDLLKRVEEVSGKAPERLRVTVRPPPPGG